MVGIDCKAPAAVGQSVTEKVGVAKATGSWWRVFILGILAGAFIGFGAELSTMVTHDIGKYLGFGFAKFMAGSTFSVGLILVVIAGAELFTGNNLMTMSALDKRISVRKLLGRWGWIYLANFVGSMLLVWIMYGSGLWKSWEFRRRSKGFKHCQCQS